MEEQIQREVLLAQWQTCVEMANSVSQRRDTMNNIFVTINLALIAAVSLAFDFKSIFLLAAGIVLCFVWKRIITNYRLLNSAKFKVILELEEKLAATPFGDEQKILSACPKYHDGTKLETILPILFIVLYVVLMIVILANSYSCLIGGYFKCLH